MEYSSDEEDLEFLKTEPEGIPSPQKVYHLIYLSERCATGPLVPRPLIMFFIVMRWVWNNCPGIRSCMFSRQPAKGMDQKISKDNVYIFFKGQNSCVMPGLLFYCNQKLAAKSFYSSFKLLWGRLHVIKKELQIKNEIFCIPFPLSFWNHLLLVSSSF